jgi:uncharacterized protein with ParB-like and HNH nuclease domain
MAGEYEKAITIEKAVQQIVNRKYLLPAIQRKFTWNTSQICTLFDSIMRGYPINTFMFWEVTAPDVKKNFRFYQFLEHYCERFGENNPDFNTQGHGDFYAIVDGQQRLTSLYIGLKGTYAYKISRRWWPKNKDDSVLPPRRLYLNLAAPLEEEANEEMMGFEFKFLTKQQFESDQNKEDKCWFQVGDTLDWPEAETNDDVIDIVLDYLQKIGQPDNKFARKTLTRLYFAIRRDALIHYYNETSQAIDHVLDIFIRTNHGGTPLSFSDLLMSIAVANWQHDARQQIDDLVDAVRSADMDFSINRDFVLKTSLMLTDADVRFKVRNFSGEQVGKIEQDWEPIKASIKTTFRLIRSFGLNDWSLRAKNAAIPLAYYIYRKKLWDQIDKPLEKYSADKKIMRQWLHMSLLKSVFSGQTDTLLTTLRRIIRDHLNEPIFPLTHIIEEYRGKSKDLRFDEDFIDRLLTTQKDDGSCFSILALIQPDLDYSRPLDKDHLHPGIAFSNQYLENYDFLKQNPSLRNIYGNPEYWNSIINLQLLDASRNRSKLDEPLKDWFMRQEGMTLAQLHIPESTSLRFEDFPAFVEARSQRLKQVFKQLGEVN